MKNELTVPTGTKFQLEIEDNDGTMKTCFLKSISRPIMERALGLIMPITGAPKLITAGEIVLTGCWISGDEEIRTNEELKIEACLKVIELIERKNSTLKKF
jgi:hypothetical protein